MSAKAVRKAGKKYARQYARVAVVSVVVAAIVTAIVGAGGNASRISVLPEWFLVPFVRVFIQTFVVCFVLGVLVRVLRENSGKLRTLWVESVGGPLTERWRGLARRTQAILTGTCLTVLAGGITAAVGVFLPLPPSLIAGICLPVWPAGTYWALTRPRPTDDTVTRDSEPVANRYVTLRHLETRTIALLIGYLIAAVIGVGLWVVGVGITVTAVVAVLVWLVATAIVYNRYETVLTKRTALVVVGTESTEGGRTELSIKNEGHETVVLTDPTIKDTTADCYRLPDRLTLQPGRTVTLGLPSAFTLAPTDAERTLPLGYTLDRSLATPTIYSQTGTAFDLQRGSAPDDGETWATGEADHTTQPTGVPSEPQSQD